MYEVNVDKLLNLQLLAKRRFDEKVCLDYSISYGELTITVARDYIVEVLSFFRNDPDCRFVSLIDISGVDYPNREQRFDVCYHLLSPYKNLRLRVKLHTDETMPVASVCELFPGAEWYEREVYDMYGILFSNHPDLRRILTDYGFTGHPLRKDFPTTGFVECRYDLEQGRVVYEPVVLRQEMRVFDNLSPWEGMDNPLRDAEPLENKGEA